MSLVSSNPQDLAIKALNEKFGCDGGVISLNPVGPEEWPHLSATKTTGPSVFDFQKLTLGEIAACLDEAGLLTSDEVCRCAPTPSAIGEDSAVYVHLSSRPVAYTTEHYNGSVNVDMDDYDEPVGVEILGAVSVEIDGIEVSHD